jgi:predicted Zn-dependent peptidase
MRTADGTPVPGVSLDDLYGLGASHYTDYARAIESVTPADCLRVAQRVLRLDAYTEALISA